jgi:hypothetical protein
MNTIANAVQSKGFMRNNATPPVAGGFAQNRDLRVELRKQKSAVTGGMTADSRYRLRTTDN